MANDSTGKRGASLMLVLGSPLASTLFLFSPPKDMPSDVARKRAAIVLGLSVVLMVLAYGVLAHLTQHPEIRVSDAIFPVVLLLAGSAFLLLPASLFRLMFGVPESGGFFACLRGIVGFALFLFTFIASLVVYGLITG